MKYLVTGLDEPFLTNWFDAENFFQRGMTVFNLLDYTYTTNGIDWVLIQEDSL